MRQNLSHPRLIAALGHILHLEGFYEQVKIDKGCVTSRKIRLCCRSLMRILTVPRVESTFL